ncbi:toll/interleukin-1 receptor domain-containing protein [Bradyrhizobium sp. NBAIM01]|uniref:TIR domain-containing protein n=1 Tax=Bradyrhizobium sp. NBAIM01 TaxID=2793818 RepID=UPI001CD4E501|nr:toll/interleukin-1 receptor domain-containing protein [Bradyrhizobium sp. NBAIM01]MCA1512668.1 toll/interleukin-1 receptor domain-containing protein [Bradyrhizobium sp. NBAIM01]
MTALKIFLSYSHADEWLKDELITHFSALKRGGHVDVWHDRRIPAGGLLDDEIDENLHSADLFVFLISPHFIQSDYCFQKEYQAAVNRRAAGDAEIIPVIVRACDWDVGGLRKFNALPRDGIPVTEGAVSRADVQQRDRAWLQVIDGIKAVIRELKKKLEPPKVVLGYHDNLFLVDFVRHPSLAKFDERKILVDPDVYSETNKEQVSTFTRLAEICATEKAVLLTGIDRSGKSVILKQLHVLLAETANPAILLSGKQIRNRDIERLINLARNEQFEAAPFPLNKFRIFIDDFDDCTLPDRIKEQIVKTICDKYHSCVIVSFSNAPSVLFTSNALPNPVVLLINPITDAKLLQLVEKWESIGLPDHQSPADNHVLSVFEKIQLVFEQTGLEKAPHTAATFLQFIDSLSASDISFSSFAACYDILIGNRLGQAGVSVKSFDEIRNFLSLVAYKAYAETESPCLSSASFIDCLTVFETQYLSAPDALRKNTVGLFLQQEGNQLRFREEYLWFFLCARYVVKFLQSQDQEKYKDFVQYCTANIFQRKFANIVIYMAYFSTDKYVLDCLLQTLDALFSKASDWIISDDTRELIVGLATKDSLEIESKSDVTENRVLLLQEKIADIIDDAARVVARYTLPFLSPSIGDSTHVDNLEVAAIDHDSYMRSVNALLRTHSVIGQILSGRSGTFSAGLVIDCITRMVKASGRYVSLNHAIAAVLIYDREKSMEEIRTAFRADSSSLEERFEKVKRIFAFWSVYISHAGLARYLNQEHSIRALEKLAAEHESADKKTVAGNTPFNFTLVMLVAHLYSSGKINRKEIENAIQIYGEHSSIIALLRVVIHMYAYYMPLTIEDKQWVSQKLRMPLKKIEVQRMKAITSPGRHQPAGEEISAQSSLKDIRG